MIITKAWNPFGVASGSKAPPATAPADPKAVKAVDDFSLQKAIEQRKSDMPVRLISTEDGKMYHRNAIEARFKIEHAELFDSAVSSNTEAKRGAMEKAFAYAMLSHRWEAVEPLHKDLDGSDVYSLPESSGTRKLKNFCRHAGERGFRWAWSDTCCIDKTSTSELQQSIVSMFKWYRNSDLTIIYLGDVGDDSIEALEKSVWFLRGWTLQELIAPGRLLFYKSDWTLLATTNDLPVDNYKSSPTFRELLTKITGIDDKALTSFDPTSRHITIRQRMSWAANRNTTEMEDKAYCLMGIFNVHFPVMYGEGENAFVRLQTEIMAVSDDPTLYDWTGEPGSNSFLASSPACFDPFAPPIVDPVPTTLLAMNELNKIPLVQQAQRGIDTLTVGYFNAQERFSVNAEHPANFMAGAKIHCHGFEYSVLVVQETPAMVAARKKGETLYQYHIIAESLHPITVTLAEPIDTGVGFGRLQSKYLCILRVWDHSLATEQSGADVDGEHPLRKPFVAHLLVSEPEIGRAHV